jgi:hypothetical protein
MGSPWGCIGIGVKGKEVVALDPTDVEGKEIGGLEIGADAAVGVEICWMDGVGAKRGGVGAIGVGIAGFRGRRVEEDAGGIRVTGVIIGVRLMGGGGMGVKFPEGGGILVTGVERGRGDIGAGPGKSGLLVGTGGIGADCGDVFG